MNVYSHKNVNIKEVDERPFGLNYTIYLFVNMDQFLYTTISTFTDYMKVYV